MQRGTTAVAKTPCGMRIVTSRRFLHANSEPFCILGINHDRQQTHVISRFSCRDTTDTDKCSILYTWNALPTLVVKKVSVPSGCMNCWAPSQTRPAALNGTNKRLDCIFSAVEQTTKYNVQYFAHSYSFEFKREENRCQKWQRFR